MRKVRKYVVKAAFKDFLPQKSDFEIIEESIMPLSSQEFLVKAEYISVDPYMRSFAEDIEVPYDQFGFQVGKVIESKNPEFPVNCHVVSHSGWQDHVVLDGSSDDMFGIKPYIPDIGNMPLSLSIGALGMPGITAYLGLLEICKPKQGEIVCVTSAAGAVGSLVGQVAKLMGCTIIGFAGSDKKVQVLKQEFGFHHAINYKTTANVKDTLSKIAPHGIDCYFDNVGGELAEIIMENMKEHGRVAVCGAISTYGMGVPRRKKPNTRVSVNVESFSFTQWDWPRQREALNQLKDWIQKGTIKAKETVTNGFEELPATFVAMLKGESIGKAVVKI
ncbi:prostaglandin reductase 1-like [Ostrinia nubilalis]|uniref:prostaglandin reductase 1-like n=1 Tax=Ostrinia nubilalis TaxID=29057 RepID=UPI0030822836